ncbi:MAG: response regulator, partial [bacterium]
KVLIIDDESNIRTTLRQILEDESHEVLEADNGEMGTGIINEEQPDVVLVDIKMPGKDGLEVLAQIKKSKFDCEVIMISGHGTIESAVTAIKLGAYHFLQKPLSMIEVKQHVRHAADIKMQRVELEGFRRNVDRQYQMVGESACLKRI